MRGFNEYSILSIINQYFSRFVNGLSILFYQWKK